MNDAPCFRVGDPALRADPYPVYRFLREAAPLWQAPTGHRVAGAHDAVPGPAGAHQAAQPDGAACRDIVTGADL